jgi:hypothetical protein
VLRDDEPLAYLVPVTVEAGTWERKLGGWAQQVTDEGLGLLASVLILNIIGSS